MSPKEESRIRTFVLEKLTAFRPGYLHGNCRRQLHIAKQHILTLTNHYEALKEWSQSAAEAAMKKNQSHEAKFSAMSAEHKAHLKVLDEEKIRLEKNLENLQNTYRALSEKAEKTSKQLKNAQGNMNKQVDLNTTLAEKLKGSLLKEVALKKDYDVKRAEQQATFNARYDKLEATFKSTNKKQEAWFSQKLAEQETKIKCQDRMEARYGDQFVESRLREQEASYQNKLAEQEATFTAKSQEQLDAMNDKLTAQQAKFDADYKTQGDTYNTKCAEQQAAFDRRYKDLEDMLDLKYNKQKVAFNKMLQGERRKMELLGKEKQALGNRLQTTEIALLKSRQVITECYLKIQIQTTKEATF